MKILIINYGSKTLPAVEGGGVETLVQLFIDSIGQKDTLTVVSYAPADGRTGPAVQNNVRYMYLDRRSLGLKIRKAARYLLNRISPYPLDNAYIYEVIRRLDLSQYDVIISENGVCFGHALRKYYNGKIILHLHNDWLNSGTKFAVQHKNAYDEIWAISKFIKNRVDEVDGDVNVRVLYNGVDEEQFSLECVRQNRQKYREKYSIGETDFTFCYCGRIVEEKGVAQLIAAFQRLIVDPRFANCKLVVIGDNSLKHKYCETLKAFQNNIIWTGYMSRSEVHKVMSMADCGVAPTVHLMKHFHNGSYKGFIEAFNLTVIEFMSLGLPVLATDSGGMKELVSDGVTGYVVSCVEDRLIPALAQAMGKAVEQKWDKAACVRNAAIYSKERYLMCFYQYLREVIGK